MTGNLLLIFVLGLISGYLTSKGTYQDNRPMITVGLMILLITSIFGLIGDKQ